METWTVEKANKFIEQYKTQKNLEYVPEWHFTAPVGWINDPNGFVYFKGEYHLFYQYYPYDAVWGPMHWGHAKSKDLIHWQHLPVALAPDRPYDKDGCFSGSAIVKDDILWLMYTGHIELENGEVRQVQNMAYSHDGVTFVKYEKNPVLDSSDLFDTIVPSDFRDPKMFQKGDQFYAVIAAKHIENVGCILLAKSENLKEWQLQSIFLKGTDSQGIMWECPDYFELDGYDTLLLSPMKYPREGYAYHNLNSSVVMRGNVNWQTCVFEVDVIQEIDRGHDFYAPQTLLDHHHRRIMIGWMHTWGRSYPTLHKRHLWAHCMTIPRQLQWKDKRLIQHPMIEEHLILLSEEESLPRSFVLQLSDSDLSQDWQICYGSKDDFIEVSYKYSLRLLAISRKFLKIPIQGEEDTSLETRYYEVIDTLTNLQIIVDKSVIEVNVNNGEQLLSSMCYFDTQTQPQIRVQPENLNYQIFSLV